MLNRSIILRNAAFFTITVFVCTFYHCDQSPQSITISNLSEDGFRSQLFTKIGNESRPIVVFLGGSSGGFFRPKYLYGIVEHGFDVFSLAYFGVEGLSPILEEVELEYVAKAIDWININLNGRSRKIALMGVSRGAELSLLYASHFKNIDGLIAYSPSCIVIPESIYNSDPATYKSSWTLAGTPIEFAILPPLPEEPGIIDFKSYFIPILENSLALSACKIPVENIACPILLLSGQDDQVWPAAEMSDVVKANLLDQGADRQVQVKKYPKAGHQFFFFGDELNQRIHMEQAIRLEGKKYRFPFGGTYEGVKNAMLLSKKDALGFLHDMTVKSN